MSIWTLIENVNIYLFKQINALAGKNPILDTSMIFSAQYLVFIVLIFLLYLWFRRSGNEEDREMSMFVFLAALLSLLLAMGISAVYYHPRPFVLGLGTTLIRHAPDSSFPSDHDTVMFATSFSLLFFGKYRREGGLFFILALLVGFSRVFCGIHFPFDILGSFVIALIVSGLLFLFRNRLFMFFSRILGFYGPFIKKFVEKQA